MVIYLWKPAGRPDPARVQRPTPARPSPATEPVRSSQGDVRVPVGPAFSKRTKIQWLSSNSVRTKLAQYDAGLPSHRRRLTASCRRRAGDRATSVADGAAGEGIANWLAHARSATWHGPPRHNPLIHGMVLPVRPRDQSPDFRLQRPDRLRGRGVNMSKTPRNSTKLLILMDYFG